MLHHLGWGGCSGCDLLWSSSVKKIIREVIKIKIKIAKLSPAH